MGKAFAEKAMVMLDAPRVAVEHADMLALLRDHANWRTGFACGNPATPVCETGVDGPCWEHRRRELVKRIEERANGGDRG